MNILANHSNILTNLHFIRPYWWLTLIPACILLWILFKYLKQTNTWYQVCDSHLLPKLLTQTDKSNRLWPILSLAIAWLIAVFALAGPSWQKQVQPLYRSQIARVIAVDLSSSMLATDLNPNRMTRARYKILDLLGRFQEGRTGMVAFTDEAYTVSPLTDDSKTIASMVPALKPDIMPIGGSNIGAALQKSVKLMQQANAQTGTIYLITDDTPSSRDNSIAKKIAELGYKVDVLGIGTIEGAPIPSPSGGFVSNPDGATYIAKLNIAALQKLATLGDGTYATFSNNNQDLNQLTNASTEATRLTNSKQEHAHTNLWRDEGHWFVLFILPWAILIFRRGWLEEICQ